MKTMSLPAFLGLIGLFLVSCAEPASEPLNAEDMIHLGDTIGGMYFSRIEEYDGTSDLAKYCNFHQLGPSADEYTCQAEEGNRVFLFCMASFAESPAELDELWQATDSQMSIDGRPVDLSSFGTIDFLQEGSPYTLRAWNVAIENIATGSHELDCRLEEPDDLVENHWLLDVVKGPTKLTTAPDGAPTGQHAYTSETADLDFLLYVPEAYGQVPGRKWPLILFLHGYVDGLQNTAQLRSEFLPRLLDRVPDFPFIVVSPVRTGGRGDPEYWFREEHTTPLFGLLDEISSLYLVDGDRIYLNGGSAGGNGTWEIGIQFPDRFAALVPVMGYFGYPFRVPDNICDLKDVPIWAFHGALDETVPLEAEQDLVDAVNACGGRAQITVIPDIGHDLEVEHVYTDELIDWLLAQVKE
jgi:predicted esterase